MALEPTLAGKDGRRRGGNPGRGSPRLEAVGFRVAQGLLFARPMPLEKFSVLLEEQPPYLADKTGERRAS